MALLALLVLANLLMIILRRPGAQWVLNIIVLLALFTALAYELSAGDSFKIYNILTVNAFSLFFAMIFTLGILLVNVLARATDSHYSNFGFFSSVALVGMYLVAFANSLPGVFIGLELVSFPTIFAILLSKRVAIEAAVKLFILSAVAMALFSFGMVAVYGGISTIFFVGASGGIMLMLLALVLLVVALSFEAALFPFNLWVPDVYQGASTHVTAMLGGINKKVGFVALIEVLFLLFISYQRYFSGILYVLAILTMFYGNVVALAQKNVKRLLAYSSIAQAGYIAIGLAVGTQYALEAMVFQILSHMLMFIGAMSVVMFMESRNRNEINDYIGLYKENRFVAFCFTIILISLLGIPFTMGFVGKFLLFSSAVYGNMVLLAILGIVNSVISLYYYIRIVVAIYTDKLNAEYASVNPNVYAVILFCAFFILLFGIYPNPIISVAAAASSYV